MNLISKYLFNKKLITYSLITLMMISSLHIISPISTKFNVVILFWGFLYLLNDLFKKRNFLKSNFSILLIVYSILFFMSIIANYKINIIANIKTFAYCIFFLFIIYPNDRNKKYKDVIKELFTINSIIIVISSLISFLSLLTFVFFINFKYNGIQQGFVYSNKTALWGFYSNPNSGGMLSAISIIVTIINFNIIKKYNVFSKSILRKYYWITNIIIQSLYLILSNSRGSKVSLLSFFIFYSFIILYRKIKITNKIILFAVTLILTTFISLAYNYSFTLSKKVLSTVPKTVNKLIQNKENTNKIINFDEEDLSLDREITEDHVSTGRKEIWTYGLNTLYINPLLGHGPDNIGYYKQLVYQNTTDKYIITNNSHNGYLQILLANGILGFIVFFAFLIAIAYKSLKTIFHTDDNIILAIVGLLLAIAVNGLFENVILLTQSYITSILWIYLSYMMLISNYDIDKEKGTVH